MRQALAIVTHPANREPLDLLLATIPWSLRWPVVIVINDAAKADWDWKLRLCQYGTVLENAENGYELGAIATILRDTDLDEFVLWQDTFEFKDVRFLDDVFRYRGSVALTVAGFHYNVKWRREVLERLEIPVVRSKEQSVFWEGEFTRRYFETETEPLWTLDPSFHDGSAAGFEERFGRMNMVIEGKWYIKRKGDWGQRSLAGR